MNFRKVFFVLAICSFTPSCNHQHPAPFDLQRVRKTIETQNAKWADAMKRDDIATAASIYADDAIIMPPNKPMVKGTEEIKAYYGMMPSSGTRFSKAAFTTLEVEGTDSAVFEIGQYTADYLWADGSTHADTGKYNTMWKLQPDGSWKIYADCWNSNKPLQTIQK